MDEDADDDDAVKNDDVLQDEVEDMTASAQIDPSKNDDIVDKNESISKATAWWEKPSSRKTNYVVSEDEVNLRSAIADSKRDGDLKLRELMNEITQLRSQTGTGRYRHKGASTSISSATNEKTKANNVEERKVS